MNFDVLLDGLIEWLLVNYLAGIPVSAFVIAMTEVVKHQSFAKRWTGAEISRYMTILIFAISIPFWYAGYWSEFGELIQQLLALVVAFTSVAFNTPYVYKKLKGADSPLFGKRNPDI